MAVLQQGKSKYPFWGASVNLITGLDPLGLQTTSEATYAAMLPGISNLTNRIRYYGFYCWLLDFYFKKEKKGNSTEQNRFIRRAELMIALIMQVERNSVLQITGSNFAADLITNVKDSYFSLEDGADLDGKGEQVYWKYPSGAFGQYYLGAMQILSIVVSAKNEDNDIIYNVSLPHPRQKVSGQLLAEAFDKSLTTEIKTLFYDKIKTGKLYKSEIPELIKYFAIDTIDAEQDEWELYRQMLMDKDEPSQEVEELFTFHRRNTINALLTNATQNKDEYNWYQYLRECYSSKLGTDSNPETETNIGWYCYLLNEYWQYACGTIFWAVLQHLYSFQQDKYLPTFVNSFASSITEEICRELENTIEQSTLVSDVVSLISDTPDEETRKKAIRTSASSNPVIAAKDGLILLFQLFKNNRQELHPLKEYMSRKQTIRDGNMVDGLLNIHFAEGESLAKFVEQFILRKIIYRHQMVALRKMGAGSQATFKFFIEEQYIRFIDTFPPRNTSPRLNALKNIMFDLQVITDKGNITSLHTKLLTD
ncbi:MAG: hypothetical protein NT040_05495 [Bacteroidetes bacterium]|nr:hypothetical protein [Bacteroidota bacterium]